MASLYCNRSTRDAFRILVQEFFDTVHRITGKKLQFKLFNPDAKLHCLIFDAEAAQMQGAGDVILNFNVPTVSGISTQDPLEIIQHVAKTCVKHFDRYVFLCLFPIIISHLLWTSRNIDKLPAHVPRDVINSLKSFPSLSSHEEITSWKEACSTSPYKEVVGKNLFV